MMRSLFVLGGERQYGKGSVQASWNASGALLAACGSNGSARVFDRVGTQVAEFQLDARSPCTSIEWDASGEVRLISLQAHTPTSAADT
jgi:hypothetical protein